MAEPPNLVGSHFMLEVEDAVVGFFTDCSGLEAEYETMPYAEGGQNMFVHQLRGRLRYQNVVLRRGITTSRAMLEWFQSNKERSSRGGMTIKLLDSELNVVQTWAFSCAVPVKYTGPTTTVDGGFPIESLEIAHEGLEFEVA